jgi:outer membrane protein assembly factor BamE (lipoprotein component of BamABCDE complex)
MKTATLKILCIGVLCLFSACATRSGRVVTMNTYLEVNNGETRDQLLQKFGEPVSIEVSTDGTEIFTYIERLSLNGEVMKSTTYYFILKNGVVVEKTAKVVDRTQSIDSNQM